MSTLPSVTTQRSIYKGRTINVVEEQVDLPSGNSVIRATILHPGAVVVLPQQRDGKIVVIKQFRHALRKSILELPAGTLEADEAPVHCAERELAEEIGMQAAAWTPLGVLYPTPGFCSEIQHLFYAFDLTPQNKEKDEDEIIETISMNLNEIEQSIACGDFCDAKSIATLYRAKILGVIR